MDHGLTTVTVIRWSDTPTIGDEDPLKLTDVGTCVERFRPLGEVGKALGLTVIEEA
ncbi:MAG: hypothetical protein ACUVYA_13570 [Planctomycetota bacterium]